jgi:poly(hydroxyalkanoate) depolymerase family esterase
LRAVAANGSNCWNWFKSHDQQRDRGEPSIIADITRSMIHEYHIDSGRVYVAGLSAGGAMAAIMGAAYPELYAAVDVHSGLAVGAARDLPSAFAAMKNGPAMTYRRDAGEAPIPIIMFLGDRDPTVHPRNGDQLLAQCVEWNDAEMSASSEARRVARAGFPMHSYHPARSIQYLGARFPCTTASTTTRSE